MENSLLKPRDNMTVQIAIGWDVEQKQNLDDGEDPAAVALGKFEGTKGRNVRWRDLSSEERSEAARNAAHARWAKIKQGDVQTPSILKVSKSHKTRARSPKSRTRKS